VRLSLAQTTTLPCVFCPALTCVFVHRARKVLGLRMWENAEKGKKWDLSVVDRGFELLLVSQFTLFAIIKGNKVRYPIPLCNSDSFTCTHTHTHVTSKLDYHLAMGGEDAQRLFDSFVALVRREYDASKVHTGVFGAYMQVETTVDGPVTILVDSKCR